MKILKATFMAIALTSMAGTAMAFDELYDVKGRDAESYQFDFFEDTERVNYQLPTGIVKTDKEHMHAVGSKGLDDLYFWSSDEGNILKH